MNGKKFLWQGVALLPFIDPVRLLAAMAGKYPALSEGEIFRNTLGSDTLFVSQDHPLYDYLEGLYTKRKVKEVSAGMRLSCCLVLILCMHSLLSWIRREVKESQELFYPILHVSLARHLTRLFPRSMTFTATSQSLLRTLSLLSAHHIVPSFSLESSSLDRC